MRKPAVAAGVVMFAAPFLLLAGVYDRLPAELPVLRATFAGAALVAAKSPFMVFRVPVMNLTHGLMAAIMLSRVSDFADGERRASYAALFTTLLFALALKTNFEALELLAGALRLGALGRWAAVGSIVSVVGGLILALFRSRNVQVPWPELRLSIRDKTLLATLFAVYLAVVLRSFLVAHRS